MSEIGKRLAEPPASEIRESLYRPLLESSDDDDFHAMLTLNKAHLVMLSECGFVDAEIARTLASGLLQIEAQGRATGPVDTQVEDPYFAFEMRLGDVIGSHAAGFLHVARSRNDIGATLDRMRARLYADRILDVLYAVREQCLVRADLFADVVMPGYTHLQPAQPITFGYLLSAYEASFARDSARIAAAQGRADESSLGVAALAGSGFAIDRKRTAELLGFGAVTSNGLDTVGSRDFVTELMYGVTQLGVTWSRLAQDFHTYVSDEFSSIGFPDRVAGISSIMPQKKNPVALEFLRAQSARTIGALTGSLSAVRSTHFSVALDAVREGLVDAWSLMKTIPSTLQLVRLVVETATPQADRLMLRCDANFSTATDLADRLVQTRGLSFRDAHHVVGRVVRMALDENKTAREVDAAMVNAAALEVLGSPLDVDDAFVSASLDALASVARRTTEGGTAPDTVRRALQDARARLVRDREVHAMAREHVRESQARLALAIEKLR